MRAQRRDIYATEVFRGDIEVALKPPGQRRPISAIFKSLRKELEEKVPEARTELNPLIQDQIDDLTGVSRPVEVKIFGPDAKVLRELAARIGDFVEKAGAKDVNTNVHLGNPDLIVRPRREAIARMGLSEQDIENQLDAALYGQVAVTLPQKDRITDIRVRYPDSVRFDRNRLEQLPIALPAATATGKGGLAGGSAPPAFVMLSQVATIKVERSPNEVWRENQQPLITVTGELGGDDEADDAAPAEAGQDLGSVERKLLASLATFKMPAGYRWELAGNFRSQRIVCQSADGDGGRDAVGFPAPGLSVPQPDAAAFDLSISADLAGQRPGGVVDHRHAAECFLVHGRDSLNWPGRQERHHPDRVHRPAPPPRALPSARP